MNFQIGGVKELNLRKRNAAQQGQWMKFSSRHHCLLAPRCQQEQQSSQSSQQQQLLQKPDQSNPSATNQTNVKYLSEIVQKLDGEKYEQENERMQQADAKEASMLEKQTAEKDVQLVAACTASSPTPQTPKGGFGKGDDDDDVKYVPKIYKQPEDCPDSELYPEYDLQNNIICNTTPEFVRIKEVELQDRLVQFIRQIVKKTKPKRILEIGVGESSVIDIYGAVPYLQDITFVERYYQAKYSARDQAKKVGVNFDRQCKYIIAPVNKIPLPDESFDMIIGINVLCSVYDPVSSVEEVNRVLKKGGTFIFLQHTLAEPGNPLRAIQQAIDPIRYGLKLAGPCHVNRDLQKEILEEWDNPYIERYTITDLFLQSKIMMGYATG